MMPTLAISSLGKWERQARMIYTSCGLQQVFLLPVPNSSTPSRSRCSELMKITGQVLKGEMGETRCQCVTASAIMPWQKRVLEIREMEGCMRYCWESRVKYSGLCCARLQKQDYFRRGSLLMTVGFSCLSSPTRMSFQTSNFRQQSVSEHEDWDASSKIATEGLQWYSGASFLLRDLALTVVATTISACWRVMIVACMKMAQNLLSTTSLAFSLRQDSTIQLVVMPLSAETRIIFLMTTVSKEYRRTLKGSSSSRTQKGGKKTMLYGMQWSQDWARSSQKPTGFVSANLAQLCYRGAIVLYPSISRISSRTMLRLPVFDTAPTMTRICLSKNILQRRAIVLVLPQPGGPFMNVSAFLPALAMASFWLQFRSSCLGISIFTFPCAVSAFPCRQRVMCWLSLKSCPRYSVWWWEQMSLQA